MTQDNTTNALELAKVRLENALDSLARDVAAMAGKQAALENAALERDALMEETEVLRAQVAELSEQNEALSLLANSVSTRPADEDSEPALAGQEGDITAGDYAELAAENEALRDMVASMREERDTAAKRLDAAIRRLEGLMIDA